MTTIFGQIDEALTQPSASERIERWMKAMLISQFALSATFLIGSFIGRK